MKYKSNHLPFRTLSAVAMIAGPISHAAPLTLFTDSFDTVGVGASEPPFNNNASLVADQTGSVAPLTYAFISPGWDGYIQRGSGGQMLLAGYDAPEGGAVFDNTVYASLNYNFAADANALSSPLEIKFNVNVTDSANESNWGSIAVGNSQNLFVNDGANKFSSIFRDNGATEQFASGATVGPGLFNFADNDLVTLLFSDTAGTGSAFNGNGSVAKIYVNGDLKETFTDLGLTASDGYISFQAFGTKAYYDNLVITATSATIADPFADWMSTSYPEILFPDNQSTADPDHDGLTNAEEFAYGLIPNNGASANPIAVQLDQSTGTFSYTRRATALSTLAYSIWYSTDLATWTEDTTATEGTPILNGEVETVPVTITSGLLSNSKLFVQVRAN
jgi:hypothetical protein